MIDHIAEAWFDPELAGLGLRSRAHEVAEVDATDTG
jgi:hypothetical protein